MQTLTFDSSKIRVWKTEYYDPDLNEIVEDFVEVESGIPSHKIFPDFFAQNPMKLFIEGLQKSDSPLDVEIRASFVPDVVPNFVVNQGLGIEFEPYQSVADVVKLTVVNVDLDIDANNDDVIDDTDDSVEDIADVDTTPGKVILVNDGDVDSDGIPDYADGFDDIPGWADDDIIEGGQFVPLELTIPAALINPTIEISYSASFPSKIQETVSNPYIFPAGNLRLWKQGGSVARNASNVADGGDFVSPGRYSKTDFTFSGDTTTLYVEAIRESTSVADQIVSIIVRDEDSGLVFEDQVRLTATRFEIEGVNLEGNWEVVTHFVASTLTSDDAEGLNRAWQSYRVNIYDPRQSGITSIDIEGQSLPLSNVGGKYQTAEFYTLTEDSVLPTSASYVLVSGPDIDWEYNPGRKSSFIDLNDFNEWDAEIAQAVRDAIDEMEAGGWKPPNTGTGNPNPGAFGKEVDLRVRDKLRGKPGWLVDLAVDKDLKVKQVANQLGDTQLDVVRVKAGYNPQVGETLDAFQIEDVYELKTIASGSVSAKQKTKLTRVLNGGDANGPRKSSRR